MVDLDKIQSPADLRKLRRSELPKVAEMVRERILNTISESGGHLASSLGAVELAIAIHYVYDTPEDKIVWDVGHQSYPHKILTGRNHLFHTIRQHKGLSGFPNVEESEYDAFTVGHASTSISAAFGMALARDLKEENHHVVAVIGDGAMTGGLAYEGLNNAGARDANITVILNDNSMSISKNVGAISHYLTRVIADPLYNRLKRDVWELTGKMSRVGQRIRKVVRSIDEGIKHAVIPGKLFEDLGFRYFGPVDGHNLGELIDVLRNVRKGVTGPVLIHALTTKGKGFEYAEKDATKFHGIGSFARDSGQIQKLKGGGVTYTQAFSETMVTLGKQHSDLVAITAAMPDGTGLIPFARAFPGRCFDVGIAEGHAVTFAAGLASQGLHPVVAIYSTFLQRAYDHVIHDVALTKLPVVFCLDRAGLVGDDGPTHHGYFDLSFLHPVPHAVVMAPKDEAELCLMLKTAAAYDKGPIFIRYPRGKGVGVPLPDKLEVLPIGEPEVLTKGEKLLMLALGDMVQPAQEAAKSLRRSKIRPTLVNARFSKPVDGKAFEALYRSHSRIVTLESNAVAGGFGSSVSEAVRALGLASHVLTLGYPDRFVEHGEKGLLLKDLQLDAAGITKQIRAWLK